MPKYMILNEGTGFALYRKLFPGEEVWYEGELHRLRILGGEIWLRLNECKCGEIMEL